MTKYWPFSVLPIEKRTQMHSDYVGFFERAYGFGFCPLEDDHGTLKAANTEEGRFIAIWRRSRRNKWEIVLADAHKSVAAVFVDNLACAASAALDWLNGADLIDVINSCKEHFIVMPGMTSSYIIEK